MLQIVPALTEPQLQQIKVLFAELIEYYRTSVDADVQDLNDVPAMTGYADELEMLPGRYAPPDGRLLLATHNGEVAGCVALKKFADGVCEVKRLWVRSAFRGQGIGRALMEALIQEARRANYSTIMLETELSLKAAQAIYEAAGFEPTEPFFDGPEDIQRRSVFMKLELHSHPK